MAESAVLLIAATTAMCPCCDCTCWCADLLLLRSSKLRVLEEGENTASPCTAWLGAFAAIIMCSCSHSKADLQPEIACDLATMKVLTRV